MRTTATCLLVLLVSACATQLPDDYEIEGRRVTGRLEGSRLIEEQNNVSLTAQTQQSDRSPQAIKTVAPQMPRLAIDRGIRGKVTAELIVGRDGTVSSVKVTQSPDELLSNAVIDATRQWGFSPLIVDGVAWPFKVSQTFAFRIEP
jgi:TonB family protein